MREENKWTSLPVPSTIPSRRGFGATALGEKIYVAGGRNNGGWQLCSAEVHDRILNKWSPLPDIEKKHDGCAVTSRHCLILSF